MRSSRPDPLGGVGEQGQAGRARSRRGHRQPGQHVVAGGLAVGQGDPHRLPPADPVTGGGQHDVVGGAAPPEPAVRPGHVDPALPVHLGHRQAERPQRGGGVLGEHGDLAGAAPGGAAVVGGHCVDRSGAAPDGEVGHDHPPVGPHHRLHADPRARAGRRRRQGPRAPAVGRSAEPELAVAVGGVPGHVAGAAMRAPVPVVAGGPVLVDPGAVRPAHRGRRRPGAGAIGRALHPQGEALVSVSRQGVHQPHVVGGVVGHRRVAHQLGPFGRLREQGVAPGAAAVEGRGPADAGRPPGNQAAHLEGGDERGAPRKRVGFGLGLVLAGRAGAEGVGADPLQARHLGG